MLRFLAPTQSYILAARLLPIKITRCVSQGWFVRGDRMFTHGKLQSAFCVLLKFQLLRYSFISSFPIGFSRLENEHHSSSFFLVCLKVLYYPHFTSVLCALHVCVSLAIFAFSALSYSIASRSWLSCYRVDWLQEPGSGFLKCCSSSPQWCITFWPELPTPFLGKVVSSWKGGFRRTMLTCKFKDGVYCTGKEEWYNSNSDPVPSRENSSPGH